MSYMNDLYNSHQFVLFQSISDAIQIIERNIQQIEQLKQNKTYQDEKIRIITETNQLVFNAYAQLNELENTTPSARIRVEKNYYSARLRDLSIKLKNQNDSNLNELKLDLNNLKSSRGVNYVHQSILVNERENELIRLENDMRNLREIMIDLSKMVNEQAEIIDSIEDNVSKVADDVPQVNQDIQKVVDDIRKVRNKKLIIALISIFVILLIVAVIILAIRPWQ